MTIHIENLAAFLDTAHELPCSDSFVQHINRRVGNAPKHVDRGTRYRASSIGKPVILQMLNRWYGGKQTYTVGSCLTMAQGNFAQEVIAELLQMGGYTFVQEAAVSIHGVDGHADIICSFADRQMLVLECKSMGSHLVAGFCNSPNNDYGYLSQLAVYWGAVTADNPGHRVSAAFVVFDRGSSKMRVVPMTNLALQRQLDRIAERMAVVNSIADYDVDTLIELVPVPPAIDGKIPRSMAWSRWSQVLYEGFGYDSSRPLYRVADSDNIIRQLKNLPLQRADREREDV